MLLLSLQVGQFTWARAAIEQRREIKMLGVTANEKYQDYNGRSGVKMLQIQRLERNMVDE